MATGENRIIGKRLVNAYLSSVISISLVLLLVGVAALLLVNAGSISGYFKENMKVSVLLKPDVQESDALAFRKDVAGMRFIKGCDYISKEQGARELQALLGEDFLEVFETSPVPASIEVTLMADYVSADSLDVVKNEIAASALVDEVVYQKSLVDALNANLSRISIVLAVFITLLLFVSYVLINNTVRLNVYARRFTVHTMRLVGATRSFIRAPFLQQAVFQGIFSSLIAIVMLLGILFVIRREFSQLFEIFSLDLLLAVMGIVMASGLVICVVSTYFVVNKLVSLKRGELYF
ncbi:MAG: permease-like cell division protein FtsX [Bacteroidales bacterium]|nr:permease-like cell division protein FtsX [Bacteroides sp.]MCM1197886.1 permease-like cell division protein FtsX [Clostridium sp.]MCM1501978.1 permease-like cell division protein FtsX [Bacteroidales bacterium]